MVLTHGACFTTFYCRPGTKKGVQKAFGRRIGALHASPDVRRERCRDPASFGFQGPPIRLTFKFKLDDATELCTHITYYLNPRITMEHLAAIRRYSCNGMGTF